MARPLGIPWEQTTWFREATRAYSYPGEPTEYAVPRETGNSSSDVTTFHPGQRLWSIENLPDILYVLRPPPEWYVFMRSAKPAQKVDTYNNPIFEQHPEAGTRPRPLLEYKVLPDKIGTRETWWFFAAIRRIDPRIGWADVLMRMELENRKPLNSIQVHMCSTRLPVFAILSWHVKGDSAREWEVMSKLTAAQVAGNTTRGTTPGLIHPALGEAGGRVPLPIMTHGELGPRSRTETSSSAYTLQQSSSTNPKHTEVLGTIKYGDSTPYRRMEPEVDDGCEYPDPTKTSYRHTSPYFQHRETNLENSTRSTVPGTAVPIPIDPWLQVPGPRKDASQ